MKRKLAEIGLIILFYLLQVTLGRSIRIGGVMPNFLIILPILFGFFNNRQEGMFTGFFAGLLYDLFFPGLMGFTSLIFVIVGYISGMLGDIYEQHSVIVPVIITAISTFAYEFLIYMGNFLLQNRLFAPFYITRIILPEVVYTVLIMIALYKPVQLLNRLVESRKVKKAKELGERV